jgi:hypothetical protein
MAKDMIQFIDVKKKYKEHFDRIDEMIRLADLTIA